MTKKIAHVDERKVDTILESIEKRPQGTLLMPNAIDQRGIAGITVQIANALPETTKERIARWQNELMEESLVSTK